MKHKNICSWILCIIANLALLTTAQAATPILYENFESGVLDPRISITTVGTFNSAPGIDSITNFGSKKAFGFGLSTCSVNCFNNFVTTFTVTLPAQTYVSSIAFKEMELYGNWGSEGNIYVDGTLIGYFGRFPVNDRQADTTFRSRKFLIGRQITTLVLQVVDITNASEIFIDDLYINADDSATPPSVGANLTGSTGSITATCLNNTTGQKVSFTSNSTALDCRSHGLVVNDNDQFTVTASAKALPFAHHRYEPISGCGDWFGCKAAAEGLGGHLVTIGSAAEQSLVYAQFKWIGTYWIGLSDNAVKGTYQWVTNEPFSYHQWAPGQPNNGGGTLNCVEVLTTGANAGKWSDDNCATNLPVIGEFQ